MTRTQNGKASARDITCLFLLMAGCLVGLAIGNLIFHARVIPITVNGMRYLADHFSLDLTNYQTLSQFLWAVILSARGDILFVALIAVALLFKARFGYLFFLFACKSFIFGICGAFIIDSIAFFGSFFVGCLSWILFFVYHVALFSILLCFGVLTVSWQAKRNLWRYFVMVCGEISLVVLLNAIYYFLISICISK